MANPKQNIIIGIIISLIISTATVLSFAAVAITEEEAESIALDTVNTEEVGDVTNVELEDEDGVLVYEVEFTKDGIETDVKINAETGEVVKTESDIDERDEEEETK